MAGLRGSHVAVGFCNQSIFANNFISCQISQLVHLNRMRNAAKTLNFLTFNIPTWQRLQSMYFLRKFSIVMFSQTKEKDLSASWG